MPVDGRAAGRDPGNGIDRGAHRTIADGVQVHGEAGAIRLPHELEGLLPGPVHHAIADLALPGMETILPGKRRHLSRRGRVPGRSPAAARGSLHVHVAIQPRMARLRIDVEQRLVEGGDLGGVGQGRRVRQRVAFQHPVDKEFQGVGPDILRGCVLAAQGPGLGEQTHHVQVPGLILVALGRQILGEADPDGGFPARQQGVVQRRQLRQKRGLLDRGDAE